MADCRTLYRPSGGMPGAQLPVLLRTPYVPINKRLPPTSLRVSQVRRTYAPPVWLQAPPELVRELPEPWTYLKAGVKRLDNGINDGQDRTAVILVGGGAIVALIWYPWLPPMLVGLLWVAALAYGLSVMWLCHSGARPWRWTLRRAAAVTGLLWSVGFLWLFGGALFELTLLSLAAAQAFAYRPSSLEASNWWSDQRLVRNWTDAGIFGQRVIEDLWFRRIVPFHEDEHGMQTLTVIPMAGPRKNARVVNVGSDQVDKARPALERVMGLKVGQLHISHDDDHDAGAITLTVTPPARKDIVKAVLPVIWNYDDDLFVGKDKRSRPHTRPTWGRHAMFVGATGSGKTWAGRYEIAHAVLDKRTSFYLIDGKGDAVDWEPLHPLCKRVVLGASKAAAERAYAMLQEIEQVSDSRSQLLDDADGIVVVIDEWYRLIGAAGRYDAALAKNMAALFSELLATARSRRIRFLTFWQRGTDSYIDTDMRGNMVQRFVGVTGDKADARYPLDAVPDELPKAPGQFNYKDSGSRPVLVTMPALDRDAFAEACARGLKMRRETTPEQTDPLTSAVQELLVVEPMKPSVLLTMLPEELRPGGTPAAQAQRLGYALKKMEGVEPTSINGHRHYRLTPGVVPSQPRGAAANHPSTGVSEGEAGLSEPASQPQEVSP